MLYCFSHTSEIRLRRESRYKGSNRSHRKLMFLRAADCILCVQSIRHLDIDFWALFPTDCKP